MKPDKSQDTSWTWLQRAQGPKHEAVKLQGPRQKMLKLARQGALSKPWRRRRQGPTCIREQVNNWPRSVRERIEAEPGRKGPRPGGPACPAQPVFVPVRDPLLTYMLLYILPLPPPAVTCIHSSESRRDEGEAPGGSRRPPQVLRLLRRWPRPCPSRHGWPCVVKPWWSSGASTWIRQVVCTVNIQWWYKSILVFTLIYYELCLFICIATTCL
jgi:hypothetical protein